MEPIHANGGGVDGGEAKEEPRLFGRGNNNKEEDAAELNLGAEFTGEEAQPLFLAEAAQLLQLKLDQGNADDPEHSQVLHKSLKHLQRFDQINGQEAAVDVRRTLENSDLGLHPFEVAQIASLVPGDAEEAKAIIPSLRTDDRDDTKLNELLKIIDRFVK